MNPINLAAAPGVFTFTVPGEPLAKARPRVTRHGTYTPKDTRHAEATIIQAFRVACGPGNPDPEHEYFLDVRFVRRTRYRRDLDNMVKLVKDALNGLLWADDHQVTRILAEERVDPDQAPHTRIVVYRGGLGYWTTATPRRPSAPGRLTP